MKSALGNGGSGTLLGGEVSHDSEKNQQVVVKAIFVVIQ